MGSSPNRIVGAVFGAVYILIGLVGFFVSAGQPFAGPGTGVLILFGVNGLHNIIHILVGAALLVAALANVRAAKAVNTLVGAVYLLLGIVGFFIPADGALNILSLNTPDQFLHLASAIVLLGVGLGADRVVAPRTV